MTPRLTDEEFQAELTLVDGKRAVLEAVSKMGGISQVQKTKVEEFKK